MRNLDWRRSVHASSALIGLVVTAFLVAMPLPAAEDRWPSFRGPLATGLALEHRPPTTWDVQTGRNVAWKVDLPGLAHSSPIVWDETIYVTTAISSRDDVDFKHGLYGAGTASDDRTEHRFVVMALDAATGAQRWQTVVEKAAPIEKRHVKATYADATPATDGETVLAFFGSQGLWALETDGRVRWKYDVGRLDIGAYDAPEYEWGSSSSPILWQDLAIVQCDTQGDSFVVAIDVKTGEERWRASRDELPSWGTPTVLPAAAERGAELVTNGSNFIRAYDPTDGSELWRLGGSSQITAPTPFAAGELIVVASGRRPVKPIFVVRRGARGDLTLAAGESTSESVAWSLRGRGPYMPTPIARDGRLYVLNNDGVFDVYDVATGEEILRHRIRHAGGGFSGSPVSSRDHLYLPGEDGDVFVVEPGEEFELVATTSMGERLMATPAIAHDTLYVRGEGHLFALREEAEASSP